MNFSVFIVAAYGVTAVLILGLVVSTLVRAHRVNRALSQQEGRIKR